MPKFEPTINLGHLAIIVAWLGSVFTAYTNVIRTMDTHELRIEVLERNTNRAVDMQQKFLETLGLIQQDMAVVKTRIDESARHLP